MKSLADIQAWMLAVITDPRGASAAVNRLALTSENPDLETGRDNVERLIASSTQLSGVDRLDIYNRAYHARLLECLKIEFPCLHHTLGDSVFKQFALDYLQHYPPKDYTLSEMGKCLPTYLADTNPNTIPINKPQLKREHWCDFIVDLATLERAFLEIYDAQGSEGKTCLCADDLLGIPHDHFLDLKVCFVQELKVLRLYCRVEEYFQAYRQGENAQMPKPQRCAVAVFRQNYIVRLIPLSGVEADFLSELCNGKTVKQVLAWTTALSPEKARRTLLHWADEGMLLRSNP